MATSGAPACFCPAPRPVVVGTFICDLCGGEFSIEQLRRRRAEDVLIAAQGAAIVATCLHSLVDATIDQCEALDIVPTDDDAAFVRCTQTGVRIAERDDRGHERHRTVCPRHGYEPPFTPPVPRSA